MSKVAPQTEAEYRKSALKRLRDKARSVDVGDDAEFQLLISACQGVLEMTDDELADVLMVSRPTVNRWSNGKNLPRPGVRGAIFRWISEVTTKRLRTIEKCERASKLNPHRLVA